MDIAARFAAVSFPPHPPISLALQISEGAVLCGGKEPALITLLKFNSPSKPNSVRFGYLPLNFAILKCTYEINQGPRPNFFRKAQRHGRAIRHGHKEKRPACGRPEASTAPGRRQVPQYTSKFFSRLNVKKPPRQLSFVRAGVFPS